MDNDEFREALADDSVLADAVRFLVRRHSHGNSMTRHKRLGVSVSEAERLIDRMIDIGVLGDEAAPEGYPVVLKEERLDSLLNPPDDDEEVETDDVDAVDVIEEAVMDAVDSEDGTDETDEVEPPTAAPAEPAREASPADSPTVRVERIPLSALKSHPNLQVRVQTNPETIEQYADLWLGNHEFPNILVGELDGQLYVIDGMHRWLAAQQAGRLDILAEIRHVDLREMLILALAANLNHGLPFTSREKGDNVDRLLADPQWQNWSDVEIGRRCGVSAETVRRHRKLILHNVEDAKRKCFRKGKPMETSKPRRAAPVDADEAAHPDTDRDAGIEAEVPPLPRGSSLLEEMEDNLARLEDKAAVQSLLMDSGRMATAWSLVPRLRAAANNLESWLQNVEHNASNQPGQLATV